MVTPSEIVRSYTRQPVRAYDLLTGRWRWRNAASLAELANRQADRLTRRLPTAPTPAHANMYSALIALGRAGVVVHDWRPGTHIHCTGPETTLETRACVVGFADDETKDWLDNLLYYASLDHGATRYELCHVFELYAPGCQEYDACDGDDSGRNLGYCWVERIDGNGVTRIGGQMNAEQVRRAFPTRRSVQQELREAWQIGICSPAWGDDSMFSDLLQMLTENRRHTLA